jgi:hypothetical protein
MTFKEQIQKIKDNWLIALVVVVLFLFLAGGSGLINSLSGGIGSIGLQTGYYKGGVSYDSIVGVGAESSRSYTTPSYYPITDSGFAPQIEERLIVKTANMETEVKRGQFMEADSRLKSIIKSSDSYLLNENVNRYETGLKQYYEGYYTIKAEAGKYEAILEQLKAIGEIKSFNQDQYDVTGQHEDLKIEIEAEKQRLERYEQMYKEATEVKDKIELSDRIFNQERTIKYMEDSLSSTEQRVEYSTISFRLTEKRSEYANIIFVKLSELVAGFIGSLNALLALIFVLIPWIVALIAAVWIIRLIRRKKKR